MPAAAEKPVRNSPDDGEKNKRKERRVMHA